MSDGSNTIALSAALLAGIAGSAHCFAMCGGLTGALSMQARAIQKPMSTLRDACLYNLGRLSGYAAAGLLFGWAGEVIQAGLNVLRAAALMRLASALLVVLVAVRLLCGWNLIAWPERLGARLWRNLNPLMRHAVSHRGIFRSLLLGLLWGWLPCGLAYSMLVFAALSADALRGAAIMLAFGLGTLPSMLTSSVFASQLRRGLNLLGARRLSGAVLLGFGIWLGWAALPSPGAHRHVHATMAVAPPSISH